jgi:hypothetical protein
MSDHAVETIAATKASIGALGAKFMFHPTTVAMGKAAGMPHGFATYFAGRGGVLGDCDADVVLAAWGYFEPELVRKMWETGTAVLPARAAGSLYAEGARQWGRDHLGAVKEKSIETFNTLGVKLLKAADVQGLPLFAAWRAEPLPSDALGCAGQLLHVLREHRGSVHLLAVVALGLTPLEAHVTNRGVDGAKTFGWNDASALPKPRPALLKKAETLTDKLCIPAYSALSARESASFRAAVATMRKVVPA